MSPPHAGANQHPSPMNAITTAMCSCCNTARWFCPSCAMPGHWPVPSPAPSWPVEFVGRCPSCSSSLSLRITGYGPERREVSALERALGLPPATRKQH